MDAGFTSAEVAVATEEQLHKAIGPATRIIGISSGEPAGLGMNSSTMTAIAGGQIYPQAMFRRLLGKIHRLNRAVGAKLVLGGPGAWQVAGNPARRQKLGIDHVVTGYAEKGLAAAFRAILRDEPLPPVLSGGWEPAVPIPPIRGASTMGVVEISRGCGLGCPFCTIARVPMVHLPPETILADVQTNVNAGLRNVALLSEDFFRYGAEGVKANPEAIISLVERIRRISPVRLIQTRSRQPAQRGPIRRPATRIAPRAAGRPRSAAIGLVECRRRNGVGRAAQAGRRRRENCRGARRNVGAISVPGNCGGSAAPDSSPWPA